jgi:hypothetical protein
MADLIVKIFTGVERRNWCDRCLTSAALTVDLYAMSGDTLDAYQVGTIAGCTRCDPHVFEPE